jgi:hypothetical protein
MGLKQRKKPLVRKRRVRCNAHSGHHGSESRTKATQSVCHGLLSYIAGDGPDVSGLLRDLPERGIQALNHQYKNDA